MDDQYEKAHHATKEGESSLFCVQIDVSQFSAYTVKEEILLQPIKGKFLNFLCGNFPRLRAHRYVVKILQILTTCFSKITT